ncbi:RF-1 domain-containing protein [Tirmania nivea]|nr:RF-1 domain-containing protein [Tirmania nivea]
MRLHIPRTALRGAASSSRLLHLVGGTASRTSSYARSPSQRFLALQSPLQLQTRVSPLLRCTRYGAGMGMPQGCGWRWIQERRITAAAVGVKAVKKTNYPSRPKVKEEEIEEKFLKGSGPGGQKINKTSSAVQLRHLPTGIVVKSQATRSREQNRKIARRILAEKLEELEKGDESRAAVLQREEGRRKRSKEKKARRKYAKLAAEKNGGAVTVGTGSGARDVEEPNGDDGIEELEREGEEWIVVNEAYEDDDDDYDNDSEPSPDPDPDPESLGSGKPRSRKRSSPLPKAKDIELEHEMSFEEEQEFRRLSREFARQLQEEEAKREAAELAWRRKEESGVN